MKIKFTILLLFVIHCLCAQDEGRTLEAARLATIQYGTETEIAALIQTLKTEGVDYLDNEIITLVENTRNPRILSGALSFFGEREKSGLENRAIRAIEERDSERNETVLAAIDYLGKVKAVNARPVLQKLIEGAERRLANPAIRSLGRISGGSGVAGNAGADSAETAAYLIDFYEKSSPDDESRREIVVALGAAGSVTAVEFLAGIASNGG
ncbi:MAG: hypothetical protein FWF55_01025, partial [Treponema sp.]|nr:hypothetical protein [Treponema sp.]